MTLLPYQERVVVDREELCKKIEALSAFLPTPLCLSLPFDERGRLLSQLEVMKEYSRILSERIAAFNQGDQNA